MRWRHGVRGRHGVGGKTWCERDVAVDGGDGDDVVVFQGTGFGSA